MSKSDIYLNPKEFEAQYGSFEKALESVESIKYVLEKNGLKLDSVDTLLDAVKEYNEAVQLFHALSVLDVATLKRIKGVWMDADEGRATKTLGQIIFGD